MLILLIIFLDCDDACGCGYKYVKFDLDGVGKWIFKPGKGIENCRKECDNRAGCTSFEYDHDGNQNYECKTYIDGDNNLRTNDQGAGRTSCIKIQQGSLAMFCFLSQYM